MRVRHAVVLASQVFGSLYNHEGVDMKGLGCLTALVGIVLISWLAPGLAQSGEAAIRIPKDAYGAPEKARSQEELKKRADTYEKNLSAYNAVGDSKNAGLTCNRLGQVYEGLHEYDQGRAFYEQALAIFERIGDITAVAQTLSNLGKLHWKLGQYDEAWAFYDKTLEATRKLDDAKGEARACLALGRLCEERGDRGKAGELYERALTLFARIGDTASESQISFKLGELYCLGVGFFHNMQGDKSLGFYQRALEAARKIDDAKAEARVLDAIGDVHKLRGQYRKSAESNSHYDTAQEFYQKALAIREQMGDTVGARSSESHLEKVWVLRGQPGRVITLREKRLETARKTGDAKLEAEALESLGTAYKEQAQYDKALETYQKLVAIRTKIGDAVDKCRAMRALAKVYALRGQLDSALALYERVLEVARNNLGPQQQVWGLEDLADGYVKLGDPDKALVPHQKALEAARSAGDAKSEAIALNDLGYVCEKQARYDEALEFYEKSLAIRARIGDLAGETQALLNLGNLYRWNLRQSGKSSPFYSKAVEAAQKLGNAKLEADAQERLGYAYDIEEEYDKSLESYQKALHIWLRIGDKGREFSTRHSLAKAYARRGGNKGLAIHEEALQTARNGGDKKGEAQALTDMGESYRNQKRYREAVDHLGKALVIWIQLKDPRNEAECFLNLGRVCDDAGLHDRAVDYLDKALSLAREIKDLKLKERLIAIFDDVWSHQSQKRLWEQATKTLQMERELAHELKDTDQEHRSLGALGNCHWKMGQYDKALKYFNEQLVFSRGVGHNFGEKAALDHMRDVYGELGEHAKAVEFAEMSLALCRKTPTFRSTSIEEETLNSLGEVYRASGQYAKAVEFYERGLEIRRNSPGLLRKIQEGSALNNLGRIYKTWGRYDKAVGFYEQALQIFREKKEMDLEGNALEDLGGLYDSWGQYDKAFELCDRSIAIRRKLGDAKGEAAGLMTLGGVLERRGDSAQALQHYEQALAICSRIGWRTDRPEDLMGNLYLETGDLKKAELYLRKAGYNSSLGRLSLAKSEFDTAEDYYQQVIQGAEKSKSADELFAAYTGLGLAFEGMGNNGRAADYFRRALQLVEDLRSRVPPEKRGRFLDVRINGFRRTTPYEGFARVLLRLNHPLEAWRSSEYTKARQFAEVLSARTGNQGFDLPEDVLKFDEDLNNRLSALKQHRQAAYEKNDTQIIESLDIKIGELENKFQAHLNMLRMKYPVFAGSKYPEPMDLSQTALGPNEWVLSYDVSDSGLIIYLTRGHTLQRALFKPVTRDELEALIGKFREPLHVKRGESVEARITNFDFASGRKLAKILLADVLPEIPKDVPLIIVPADCLGVLPFEALLLNGEGKIFDNDGIPNAVEAEFFADRNLISYSQSVTALTLARNFGKQSAGRKLLVMCDPVFSEDDPREVNAGKEERTEIRDAFTSDVLMGAKMQNGVTWERMPLTGQLGESLKKADPNLTDVYKGLEATKVTFKGKDLTQYAGIVFATHGYAGTDLGGLNEPVLVLTLVNLPEGQDGFLRQSEVMGLKMNSDIVVLTACQSGLGKRVSGEGTMGMGRAFQYAGAKSVLMSLWSVEQTASVKLVENFFQHLRKGKTRLDALRLARGEIRKAGYDHPFFWASFVLVGEAD